MTEAIVFLHGFLGSRDDWQPTLGAIESKGVRKIALELPLTNSWDETIFTVGNSIPPGSLVCGYSMGARIALGCAIADPKNVKGLVFVSGNPGITDETERNQRYRHDCSVAEKLENSKVDVFLSEWYRQPVFQGLTPQQFTRLVDQRTKTLDVNRHAHLLRVNSIGKQPNYWLRLQELRRPVYLVAGDLDSKYRSIIKQMHAVIPRSQVQVIPSCGHAVPFEKPGKLAEVLKSLADSLI